MKAKTVKRHVIVLDDYEARLIYFVLRHFEGKDFREIDAIGINRDKLHELKQSFHELFKERSADLGTEPSAGRIDGTGEA